MAYGLAFYKGVTTGFDDWIATTNATDSTLAAQNLAAQIEDNTGISATRALVVEAFQTSSITPLLPSNTEIRQWMISGLGNNNQTFDNYYANLYYNDSNWRTKVIADRQFQTTVLSPLTLNQSATKDSTGRDATVFLLGIDNGTIAEDVTGNTTITFIDPIVRDDSFHTNFPPSNYLGTVGYNGSSTRTVVQGGDFVVPANTDWCAEAWIYPARLGGGIIGSGDYVSGAWQIYQNPSGAIQFFYEGSNTTTTNGSFQSMLWNYNSIRVAGAFPPAGLSVGSKITVSPLWGATELTVTGFDGDYSTIYVTPPYNGGSDGEGGTISYRYVYTSDEYTTEYNPESLMTYQTTTTTPTLDVMDSGAATAPLFTWTHVAISLSGTTLGLFVNGTRRATRTIQPAKFNPSHVNGAIHLGIYGVYAPTPSYFQGYISNARMVNGKAVYTNDFTPSTLAPRATRASVIKAYSKNLTGPVQPSERDVQYWMFKGFDPSSSLQFSTTDVTWNQVDTFFKPANTIVSKTYDSCANREMLVTQVLIGTPDINATYYANSISTNSSGGVYIDGGTVDALITVMMR